MKIKPIRRMFLLAALALPAWAWAQASDRAEIRVLNDWDESVSITIIAERREEMVRRNWDFEPGQSSYLGMTRDGELRRIHVRSTDRIKIRADSRPVAIGDVARMRDGHWFVKVRDVYRAQRGRDERRRNSNGG